MEAKVKLFQDDEELLEDPGLYRQLIGKLLYLTITWPNLSYPVNRLSQFLVNLRSVIFKLLIEFCNILKDRCDRVSTFLPLQQLNSRLLLMWIGQLVKDSRQFISGFCIFLGNSLVSWKSKKQNIVSRSSAAKYRATTNMTCELVWLLSLSRDFGIEHKQPTILYYDNEVALHISTNPVFHEWPKHIEIDCHFFSKRKYKQVASKHSMSLLRT